MNKRNFQKELDKIIEQAQSEGKTPTLLLHSCCAPCSSYCLEYLSEYFSIAVLYFNPNIYPEEEYIKRLNEQKRLVDSLPSKNKIGLIEGKYEPECFFKAVKGLENEPERGARCKVCYRLRLEEAAKTAKKNGFDYFATTLTLSPLKDSEVINSIAEDLSEIYQTNNLPSDFKKREGYKRSIELSRQFGLYRQNFCGCIFSKPTHKSDQG